MQETSIQDSKTSIQNSRTSIQGSRKERKPLIPRWEQLPAVDLYMDQVVAFVNSGMGRFFRHVGCQPLTKNMVNNYVKAKIIVPPVNKKYDRVSLAMIIVVYLLKTCFSTEEVARLIKLGQALPNNAATYDRFCASVESALYSVFSGRIHVDDVNKKGRERRYLMDNFALAFACKAYVHRALFTGASCRCQY